MSTALTTCDRCLQTLSAGDWPWCPHGRGQHAVISDDVPGGFTAENGFDTPQTFYSHSAHEAALAARGLEIRAKWAGPTDRHLTNWGAAIDAQTLDNARVLLTRGTEARQSHQAQVAAAQAQFPIAVRTLDVEDVGR